MRHLSLLIISIFVCFILNAQSLTGKTSGNKKSFGISIELPFLSNGISYDYAAQKNVSETGYLGGGISLFYEKNKNKFFATYEHPSLKKSMTPLIGGSSDISANLLEFTVHHTFRKSFAFIAGANYAVYHYHFYNDVLPMRKIDTNDATIGVNVAAEYLPGKSTAFGFCFKPSLFSFDTKSYRHIFSLFFRYDINIWKK